MIDPPCWDEERLEQDRRKAIELFRHERLEEPVELYTSAVDAQLGVVEDLLEQTVDLQCLDDEVLLQVLTSPKHRDAFRYLAGPPVSDDDWTTLAEAASLAPGRLRENPEAAKRLAQVVLNTLDRRRFPWLPERREPTEAERNAAVLASACLWAYQRMQTARRSSGKKRLEDEVKRCLTEVGFEQTAPRNVRLLQDAPLVGRFCGECSVASRRADFVVGLWDGRHALIECKDTNSYVNSVKRLNNDTAAKAAYWIRKFGEQAAVPIAVVSGVFYHSSLSSAQEAGLAIFWGHGMTEFRKWVQDIRASLSK